MGKGGGGGRKASGGSKGMRKAFKVARVAERTISSYTKQRQYSSKRLEAASKYLTISKRKRGPITFTTVKFDKNAPKYLKPPKSPEARQRYYRQIAAHMGTPLPAIFPGRFD